MYLDSIDRRLLNLLQAEFPLTREPYSGLGQRLGIDGSEVISHIERLKAAGIIRQISPVMDARRLGYQPTLVAMKVAEGELDRAERVISQHPGVSHGYERDHFYNLWFTLAIPSEVDIDAELQRLAAATGAAAAFALPALKVFKIGAYFDMDENGQEAPGMAARSGGALPEKVELSPMDRLIIRELQQDLPLESAPFNAMAAQLNMDVTDFLQQCQALLKRGVMRRFGAAINHHRAGFNSNAMACWVVPPDMVEAAGRKLTERREVSHCYERKTNKLWQYNLFAMIHSHTRRDSREIVASMSRQIGVEDCVLLFSTKEFKKTRVKYLV